MNKIDKAALSERWFKTIVRLSVGAVLFLILVGGIVRSTGSGMGCPDWPLCFGLAVPPIECGDIPREFFEIHPEYGCEDFNVAQTWTEYLNRLVGATLGLIMLTNALLSLVYRKKDVRITILCFLALFLTIFEAWLGKLVVEKNLQGGMVTIHMLGAIFILLTLLIAVFLVSNKKVDTPVELNFRLKWMGIVVLLFTVVQLLIGTQVRENVDAVIASMPGLSREEITSHLGLFYAVHKSFWIIVLLFSVVWIRDLLKMKAGKEYQIWIFLLIAGLFAEVLIGIVLGSLSLPPYLQPMHLLIANFIIMNEIVLLLPLTGMKKRIE